MDFQRAKLHLETSILMGVDFLPIASHLDTAHCNEPASLLVQLSAKHDDTCEHCSQNNKFTQTVFGIGNPNAQLMFIGGSPSDEEDLQGIPFVGEAGNKLNEIITAMGMQRENVYITNVLKSKLPNNRTPSTEEVAKCAPFLAAQVAIIQPDVIVALGSTAATFLLGKAADITQLRGTWATYEGIAVLPTFHPAFLLQNYTKEIRAQIWADMQQVMAKLD